MARTSGKTKSETAQVEVVIGDIAVDLDAKKLPAAIETNAFSSGGYPYPEPMKRKQYEEELRDLQIDLLKLQAEIHDSGKRLVVIFEGRDSAGKGGTIARFTQHLNPRSAHVVALAKPSDTERGQWYFQRYVSHLPTSGEIVLFDRSWYNRAVVEPVMGFCSQADAQRFYREAPQFESMLVRSGTVLVKLWLTVGREMQLTRLHARRHDPLKQWKLSPIDYEGLPKWDAYTQAAEAMFDATHTPEAPWTIVRANDKRRLRIACLRHVLTMAGHEPSDGKKLDPKIAFDATAYRAAGYTP
jgi:polyphosphate kinase 2